MKKEAIEKNTDLISKGKILHGVVVSDKMKDTVVVSVSRYFKNPRYGKFVTKMKKYKAHDLGNACKIGDKVDIQECKPLSKTKHFKVIK